MNPSGKSQVSAESYPRHMEIIFCKQVAGWIPGLGPLRVELAGSPRVSARVLSGCSGFLPQSNWSFKTNQLTLISFILNCQYLKLNTKMYLSHLYLRKSS